MEIISVINYKGIKTIFGLLCCLHPLELLPNPRL